MRALAFLMLTALPAQAWQAGVEGSLCTLTHSEPGLDIRLTYDPVLPEYTITLTLEQPWPDGPVFGIRFEGASPNTITTGNHQLSDDRRALTVTDRGFGNVLNGLAENETATAFTAPVGARFGLDGAAPEVAVFRACVIVPSA
ncbi:hypothetical protein GTA62_17030 [Roseobacter sp. HKCCD9010]|uniref:hypothetical protein n=1 Tax=unclassified Roseobacter TaxID=196798 RepID=UPI00149263C0|nr:MULTISPECIES: hypothetical protein [unclassified Roseobacter]NNV39711.1 hypothetical protein [Roseobacter sp. HKCCD9054]NNV65244.1 hypothetical protein [Roseobacter sp. HKCCD8434]NNV78323.1 hypothetical protein [Roseobacter sp. HKCCD6135]NNV99174.1 hypothetical protein [Roseobacter sp. HKCCD6505]NNW03494.1 hypothetical protein [Roseobacter sp. HKCCD9022]NNW07830.1 hypothetical protein [Roseobacter sp. HKCCD8431]NNW16353.1 hypothetical protein [Roseobacter sp. HKCCD8832]NNW24737.1 hypothe